MSGFIISGRWESCRSRLERGRGAMSNCAFCGGKSDVQEGERNCDIARQLILRQCAKVDGLQIQERRGIQARQCALLANA